MRTRPCDTPLKCTHRKVVSAAAALFLLASLLSACNRTQTLDAAATTYTLEAEAKHTAEDAEASEKRAAILYSAKDRVTFRLKEVPSGTYRVGVRARAQAYYKGWPILRLERGAQRLGEDRPIERATYGVQTFKEVALEQGQVITATFVNDRYDGPGEDRNLLVDTLVLEPVQNAAPAEPDVDGVPVSLGDTRTIQPNLFGFNNDQTIRGVARDNEAYNEALRSLSPGTLRFPGGTMANYWDWERADFVCGSGGTYQLFNRKGAMPCNLPNGYQSLNPPSHSLENFKTELERTSADAVFVLNMLTKRPGQTESNLSIALRMLSEAKRLGIAVQYVELGNEFYLPHGDRDASKDYQIAFPNANAYAREAQRWIGAIRKDFPDVKIAAVGADKRVDAGERRNTWNARLTEALAGQADALSVHTYAGGSGSTASFLATPQTRLDNLKDEFDALPQNLPLWITEYNLFARDEAVQGTWAHGLFAATQTLSLLQEEDVELVHFHSGIGNAVFGALFRNDSGFDYGSSSFPAPANPPATVPFARTASGQTLQLVGGAVRGATSAQQLDFAGAPRLPEGSPALVGWRFESRGESILLNLSGSEQALNVPDALRGGSFVQRSAAPTLRITGRSGEVSETQGTVGTTLKLRAYSITRVRADF